MPRVSKRQKPLVYLTILLSLIGAGFLVPPQPIGAADHADAPNASIDKSADINDVYAFLDPNDNTKVILQMTVNGFIVPAEALNFGVFDHNLRYRLELETTGDALSEYFIDVTFTPKMTSGATPQTATITSNFFTSFTAPTTPSNLTSTPPDPVITTDAATGIAFYAGVPDDPFFFDIPGFNRFVASVLAGSPNPAQFNRARDSFAGYNTLAYALSIPRALINPLLSGAANNTLGVLGRTARLTAAGTRVPGRFPTPPTYTNVDRMGNPAVNVTLIPFPRKSEYNLASPSDDQRGDFVGSIVGTLTALGTNAANIQILADVAITRGDFLRLNLNTANSGAGGGTNAGAGFPNGRRLADDTVDTLLFFIANQNVVRDNVNANDVPLRNTFPFFGAPQQPREGGTDDNTRN
jgi:hypothetical protein